MDGKVTININQKVDVDLEKRFSEFNSIVDRLLEEHSDAFKSKIDEINNYILKKKFNNIITVSFEKVMPEFKKHYLQVIVAISINEMLQSECDFDDVLKRNTEESFMKAVQGRTMISAVEAVISNKFFIVNGKCAKKDFFDVSTENTFFALLEEHFIGEVPSWVKAVRGKKNN